MVNILLLSQILASQKNRSVDEESYIGENNVEFGVEETTSTLEAKENIGVEPSMACTDFSDALHVEVEETQEEPVEDSNLNLKGEEYNRLLKQYYELEEKRQKILEQLYQCGAGGWNYQNVNAGSNVGTQWGAYAANQEHPVSASQPSYYPAMPSYLPTSYPIVVGPQSTSLDDGDIIKTAMDSATRAISSSMETVNKGKESDRDDGIMRRSGDSSQTDLATVLNAWYSAGFHTGKYLMEQSHAKN